MTVYLLRRLLQAAGVVLAMSVLVFVGVYAIGDPVEILISPDADQIERERAIEALGLNLPLWQQYLLFLGNALHPVNHDRDEGEWLAGIAGHRT